jgi:hypothetical protein
LSGSCAGVSAKRPAIKKCNLIVLIVFIGVLAGGCISASSKSPDQKTNADIPDFVRNTPVQEDEVFGIGSAKNSSVSSSLAVAEQRARQSLTVQLNANVHTIIIN